MALSSNGVCKKNKAGFRVHAMIKAKDGDGRDFVSCFRCGAMFVDSAARA
jgi:hypothetical protein